MIRCRAVIDIVHVVLQLNGGVDGLTLPAVCILVHDDNNGAKLGINDGTTSANGDVGDFMVVDTGGMIAFEKERLHQSINQQITIAIHEAAVVIMVVEAEPIWRSAWGEEVPMPT